jgi:glutathione S-transferase
MKLYHTAGSPPSRAVLMTIRNLDIDVDIEHIDLLKGDHLTADFLKLNPNHQVPVLVDGEFALSESRAIQAYLVNSRKPGITLYPSDAKTRAIVDQRLYFDATNFFPLLRASLVRKN